MSRRKKDEEFNEPRITREYLNKKGITDDMLKSPVFLKKVEDALLELNKTLDKPINGTYKDAVAWVKTYDILKETLDSIAAICIVVSINENEMLL